MRFSPSIHLCCTLHKSSVALVPKEITPTRLFHNVYNELPAVMWVRQAETQPQVINAARAALLCSRKEAN